jgi:hypothetical protein
MNSHFFEEFIMPYVAGPKFLEQADVVGNGQCVTLVKKLTGAPASSLWQEGDKIGDIFHAGKSIPRGTAIATFVCGKYPNYFDGNHAAIFIRHVPNGIEVFDQWSGTKPGKRTIRFGMPKKSGRGRMAENYSVVR